ncbi:hypothetical protein FA95DRAFT_672159 [Auriscalpium vulgare]|uniref:Uncharacterized protein n=1 Tax=Auriscalpium vulgare TaxID=40419 RepID=A0ACB8RCS7_9AGAM|nr:hypothetical protein FA95DRAFT_672159 [Auriscalpium vulgare]
MDVERQFMRILHTFEASLQVGPSNGIGCQTREYNVGPRPYRAERHTVLPIFPHPYTARGIMLVSAAALNANPHGLTTTPAYCHDAPSIAIPDAHLPVNGGYDFVTHLLVPFSPLGDSWCQPDGARPITLQRNPHVHVRDDFKTWHAPQNLDEVDLSYPILKYRLACETAADRGLMSSEAMSAVPHPGCPPGHPGEVS